jgi:hypothetical protein
MRRPFPFALMLAAPAVGCIAFGEPLGERLSDREQDTETPIIVIDEAPDPGRPTIDLDDRDPHAVLGVDPSHGPFTGGTTVVVRGRGFSSEPRVWVGDQAIVPENVIAIDPGRIQVVVPSAGPGPADVTVQNGDDASTRRTQVEAYVYDAFYLDPDASPLTGDVVTTVHGLHVDWTDETEVFIDRNPCEISSRRSLGEGRMELDCRVPPGTPGSKAVQVRTGAVATDVLDAFMYADSIDGFRGGLNGAALDGSLRVIALDNVTGSGIALARVILGTAAHPLGDLTTDVRGVASAEVTEPTVTVTIAATCYHPITFVDVPVDTLTAYLDPILSPACQPQGDPPSVAGSVGTLATLRGELVFSGGQEFRRGPWSGVPVPVSGQRAAYVLPLSRSATGTFRLPSAASAVTPASGGSRGYAFEVTTPPGTVALYAVAGIENRDLDPPLFTAYAMGVLVGIRADPDTATEEIYLPVDNRLDRGLELIVHGPQPTTRGPDRLRASVAVRVGRVGYALLPNAGTTSLLPTSGSLDVVGLPALLGSLT